MVKQITYSENIHTGGQNKAQIFYNKYYLFICLFLPSILLRRLPLLFSTIFPVIHPTCSRKLARHSIFNIGPSGSLRAITPSSTETDGRVTNNTFPNWKVDNMNAINHSIKIMSIKQMSIAFHIPLAKPKKIQYIYISVDVLVL